MTTKSRPKRQTTGPGFYRYEHPREETLEADDDEHVALLCALGGFARAITREGETYHAYPGEVVG